MSGEGEGADREGEEGGRIIVVITLVSLSIQEFVLMPCNVDDSPLPPPTMTTTSSLLPLSALPLSSHPPYPLLTFTVARKGSFPLVAALARSRSDGPCPARAVPDLVRHLEEAVRTAKVATTWRLLGVRGFKLPCCSRCMLRSR